MRCSAKKFLISAPFVITIIFLTMYLDYGLFTNNNIDKRKLENRNAQPQERQVITSDEKETIEERFSFSTGNFPTQTEDNTHRIVDNNTVNTENEENNKSDISSNNRENGFSSSFYEDQTGPTSSLAGTKLNQEPSQTNNVTTQTDVVKLVNEKVGNMSVAHKEKGVTIKPKENSENKSIKIKDRTEAFNGKDVTEALEENRENKSLRIKYSTVSRKIEIKTRSEKTNEVKKNHKKGKSVSKNPTTVQSKVDKKMENEIKSVNLKLLEQPFNSSKGRPYFIGLRKAFNENVVDIELTKHILKCFNIDTGLPEHLKNLFYSLDESGSRGKRPTIRNATILGDYYEKPYTKQSLGDKCNNNMTLSKFGPETSDENQIFFLETSGRGHLSPRQACAVESAAKSSKLPVKVILLSDILNLEDNITCHLYTHLSLTLSFYTVDLPTIFADTPLQKLEKSGKFAKSNFSATHYSDGLRLALVYKYGGFYSDLDVVVLHPLNTLTNVIGQTSANPKPNCHRHLANGEFHFIKGHKLLWKTMKLFQKKFRGKSRIEVGPMLITTVIKSYYKHKWITDIKPSAEITLLPPEIFYPFKAFQAGRLWPTSNVDFKHWKKHFQFAVMVHFYGSMTNKAYVTGDPRHEAYSLLGPHYCPLSFYGTNQF